MKTNLPRRHWYLVEVEDSILQDRPLGDGVKLRYLVTSSLTCTEEPRTLDEVVDAAYQKGFEGTYNTEPPPWVAKDIELMLLKKLREKLGKNVRSFAVSFHYLARLTKYHD